MRVLFVEPDDRLASQYTLALGDIAEVVCVPNAQLAIHAVDEFSPDVVVLELQLAAHNGVEFLYELRSYADVQNIPVILHTYVDPDRFASDEALLHELGIVA